ncbi:hypothetical protein ACLOJK_027436 [Asimina triloba]
MENIWSAIRDSVTSINRLYKHDGGAPALMHHRSIDTVLYHLCKGKQSWLPAASSFAIIFGDGGSSSNDGRLLPLRLDDGVARLDDGVARLVGSMAKDGNVERLDDDVERLDDRQAEPTHLGSEAPILMSNHHIKLGPI